MEQMKTNDRNNQNPTTKDTHKPGQLDIEEFSIVELEDRLEFLDRCDNNCNCTC